MKLSYLPVAAALLLLMGCGATPGSPTVIAGATKAAPTVQAAVPTVQAAATAAAPIAATAAPVAATVAAASPVQVVAFEISPTDTLIRLKNTGTVAVDVSGWGLRVGNATATLPANTRVDPGVTVTVHTAAGTSAGTDVYLGQAATTLLTGLQPGARIALVDNQGRVVSEFASP